MCCGWRFGDTAVAEWWSVRTHTQLKTQAHVKIHRFGGGVVAAVETFRFGFLGHAVSILECLVGQVVSNKRMEGGNWSDADKRQGTARDREQQVNEDLFNSCECLWRR